MPTYRPVLPPNNRARGFVKASADVETVTVDWTDLLTGSDTITSAAWTVTTLTAGSGAAAALAAKASPAPSTTSTTSTAWFESGKTGAAYLVTCAATTAAGRIISAPGVRVDTY